MREQRPEETRAMGANARPHGVTLENRNRAVLSGINDVKSFHEEEVVLATAEGDMVISGKGLHIARLTLEDGSLVMDGQIDAIAYQDGGKLKKNGSVLRRMLR